MDDKFRDEKVQCNINREAAKTSALSSGRINKLIVRISYWYYSYIRWVFRYYKGSFRENIKTNRDNGW